MYVHVKHVKEWSGAALSTTLLNYFLVLIKFSRSNPFELELAESNSLKAKMLKLLIEY